MADVLIPMGGAVRVKKLGSRTITIQQTDFTTLSGFCDCNGYDAIFVTLDGTLVVSSNNSSMFYISTPGGTLMDYADSKISAGTYPIHATSLATNLPFTFQQPNGYDYSELSIRIDGSRCSGSVVQTVYGIKLC